MPELPEVETIVRQLSKFIKGKKIIGVEIFLKKLIKNVSPDDFIQTIKGRTIKNIQRRAKLVVFDLGGIFLLVHLKLTGRLLYLEAKTPVAKHTHLIFKLSGGGQLRYWDLRQFGYFKLIVPEHGAKWPQIDELKEFGPEPLAEDFTFEKFKEIFHGKNKKIKPLLMDPGFIAGIGNIYADEILHYASIHPQRSAATLKESELKMMYLGLKKILGKAIEKRGSSIDDYQDAEGHEGGYAPYLKAYGREGKNCLTCGRGQIKRIKIGSRSAYFCPHCQK